MRLLPKVSTVSTNLRRWKPEEGEDADDLSCCCWDMPCWLPCAGLNVSEPG